MAAALRVFSRPLARRVFATPVFATASSAVFARALSSKRNRHIHGQEELGTSSQQPQQQQELEQNQPPRPPPSNEPPPENPATPPASPLDTPPPRSSVPSLDFSPDSPGGRTGARSARTSDGPTANQKRAGRVLTFLVALGLGTTVWHFGREWEPEELSRRRKEPLTEDTGVTGFFKRLVHRSGDAVGLFSEPAWEELLPPPLPAPHQKPYTLLLSLDDLLVTSTWDRTNGWRTAKRPGVDYFLAYMSQFYEIVVFTSQPFYHAGPILEKLDPYNFYIMYRLFREGTRFVDGKVVKDLSFLNRDLGKVVALDTHPEHLALQPDNAVICKPWEGEAGDSGLIALIPFLESIAIYKPEDVRPILNKYYGKDVPTEYAIEEARHKEAFLAEWRAKNKGRANPTSGLGGGSFTIGGLFGGSPARPTVTNEPMTYLEIKRREAQQEYLNEQAYLKKNEGQFKKMIEDDMKERERLAKEAGGSVAALMRTLLVGPPEHPEQGSPAQPTNNSPSNAADILKPATEKKN